MWEETAKIDKASVVTKKNTRKGLGLVFKAIVIDPGTNAFIVHREGHEGQS